jgi:hypothetical protein
MRLVISIQPPGSTFSAQKKLQQHALQLRGAADLIGHDTSRPDLRTFTVLAYHEL